MEQHKGKRDGGRGKRKEKGKWEGGRGMGLLLVGLSLVMLTACSGEDQAPKQPMTQRQRDSAIGASRLPGAQGVRGALRAADSAQARSNLADTIN